jgi:hypothetical protein
MHVACMWHEAQSQAVPAASGAMGTLEPGGAGARCGQESLLAASDDGAQVCVQFTKLKVATKAHRVLEKPQASW